MACHLPSPCPVAPLSTRTFTTPPCSCCLSLVCLPVHTPHGLDLAESHLHCEAFSNFILLILNSLLPLCGIVLQRSQEQRIWRQKIPRPRCHSFSVAEDRLLNFSKPQFLPLYDMEITAPCSQNSVLD